MTERKPREKPLFLDMDPDEALERFLQTDPEEVRRLIDRKKPPPKRGQSVDEKARPKPKPSG
jgi:cellulose biosynthesis protein BcsQ